MSQPGPTTNKRSRDDVESDDGPSSLPQTKKPRQDASDGSRRDKDFWEDDGTIVLIARDVEFKVYKGILAHHSTVFADMFSLPQPAKEQSNNGAIEGPRCPVVHLSDSPYDLRHVLRKYMPRRGTEYVTDPSLNH